MSEGHHLTGNTEGPYEITIEGEKFELPHKVWELLWNISLERDDLKKELIDLKPRDIPES